MLMFRPSPSTNSQRYAHLIIHTLPGLQQFDALSRQQRPPQFDRDALKFQSDTGYLGPSALIPCNARCLGVMAELVDAEDFEHAIVLANAAGHKISVWLTGFPTHSGAVNSNQR